MPSNADFMGRPHFLAKLTGIPITCSITHVDSYTALRKQPNPLPPLWQQDLESAVRHFRTLGDVRLKCVKRIKADVGQRYGFTG